MIGIALAGRVRNDRPRIVHMKTLPPLLILVLVLAALSLDGPANAQDYFRELDTRPVVDPYAVDPYLDDSVYNEPLSDPLMDQPIVETPSGVPGPIVETAPRFEATSYLDPAMPPTAEEEERYNWAFGPLRFNVAAGIGLEYNDNVNLAPSGQEESSFILRPSLTLDSVWRLSEMNTLRFSLGISYAKYFNQSQYSSLLISPQSILALSIMVGDVRITVRDRFSYQEDPYDLVVLSNVARYRRFENQAGIQFDWAINPDLMLTAGYDHYNLWSFEEEFDSLTRAVDTLYMRPAFRINPSIRVGLNTSVSRVRFQEDIQNNGTSLFVGPFLEAAITDSTRLYLELGWQLFDFDRSGLIPDTDNASTPYVRAEIFNQLSEYYSHRLGYTRTAEVGYNTNFYELNHVEYTGSWEATPRLIAFPTLFYEHYKTSGSFPEKANRYGAGLGLRYILTPSVTLGLDYRFIKQDSNIVDSDYRQNLIMLSLFYNF